jgi:hypothetical protein
VNIEVIVRYLKQTKDKLTLGWFCSMFRKNDSHYQDELFSHYQSMRPSVAKLLNKTWHQFSMNMFFVNQRRSVCPHVLS